MVFVHADAVETELVGEFELGQIAVVERLPLHRIVVGIRQRHPCGIVLLDIVEIEIGIGHQVEEKGLHHATLRRKSTIAAHARSAASV